jgi:hypothetical protein
VAISQKFLGLDFLVLAGSPIILLGKQHLHQKSVVGSMALRVFEIQVSLSALSHFPQVRQQA